MDEKKLESAYQFLGDKFDFCSELSNPEQKSNDESI
jgi:hypothetical protein